jgi:hypothetical protein
MAMQRGVRATASEAHAARAVTASGIWTEYFGDLNGEFNITRSPTRWVTPDYVLPTRNCLRSLQ